MKDNYFLVDGYTGVYNLFPDNSQAWKKIAHCKSHRLHAEKEGILNIRDLNILF